MGATFSREMKWIEDNVPPQTGKVIVVTGANSGLGLEATRVLAYKGAKVIMACRSMEKGREAMENLINGVSEMRYKDTPNPMRVPRENLDVLHLDLSDFNLIEKFAKEVMEKYPKIDCLINNAGLMALSPRESTAQGMEMQIGVNVVGHYALTCRLIPALQKALEESGSSSPPRIVFMSSAWHKSADTIDFDDFDKLKSYDPWESYAESKLGQLLMMQKFSDLFPQFIVSGCHPGYSDTNLQDGTSYEPFNPYIAQTALMGSLPTVMAAVDPTVKSHEYFGPYFNMWGSPSRAGMRYTAKDPVMKERLFKICQEKTGLTPEIRG